jgi:hypothetical protein
VKSAADHGLQINAILMGSPPGAKTVHAFPMDNLDDWSRYASAVVGRYKDNIRYWEVWNEGNGGFNDGKHTTADYARLAIATYEAAKKADPNARVGLTVASFDAPYLRETVRAMAAAGKPNCFDFLCVHPYEIADGLEDTDGEVPFLWMGRTLRSMLSEVAPQRADAEIWITEIGYRLGSNKDGFKTEQDAARALAKMYTMSIAQGVTCTQWFEAQDPIGEDQGFGLLARAGKPRLTYQTLKTLVNVLGLSPKYYGWLALGPEQRGYGFVFAGRSGPVLIAWMPAERRSNSKWRTIYFSRDVQVTDLLSGKTLDRPAGQPVVLADPPVLIEKLPPEVIEQARENVGRTFPWGGDYSSAKSISFTAGLPDNRDGVFPRGRANYPTVTFSDGTTGLIVKGGINHPISFYAHPSFASVQTRDYHVRATVRRLAPGNVGMNLRYEVADSQGRMPYANVGRWFGVSQDSTWQTYTWHCKDACLSKMWGHDFTISPEQSIPFAIGKIEVSTVPFE